MLWFYFFTITYKNPFHLMLKILKILLSLAILRGQDFYLHMYELQNLKFCFSVNFRLKLHSYQFSRQSVMAKRSQHETNIIRLNKHTRRNWNHISCQNFSDVIDRSVVVRACHLKYYNRRKPQFGQSHRNYLVFRERMTPNWAI